MPIVLKSIRDPYVRAELERHLNNLESSGGGDSAYGFLKRGSTSTATAAPTLVIPWDAADSNLGTDITWSSGNNTRFTIATTGTYRVGGYLTYQSGSQRTQAVIDILINGVSTGDYRSSSYVRNSGTSWDYWAMELSPEPFNLTAGDYVELALVRTSGAGGTYGTGGSNTVTFRGQSSKFWIERVA